MPISVYGTVRPSHVLSFYTVQNDTSPGRVCTCTDPIFIGRLYIITVRRHANVHGLLNLSIPIS